MHWLSLTVALLTVGLPLGAAAKPAQQGAANPGSRTQKLDASAQRVLDHLGVPAETTGKEKRQLRAVVAAMPDQRATVDGPPPAWAGLVKAYVLRTGRTDVEALVAEIIATAYLEKHEGARLLAHELTHVNQQRHVLGREINRQRNSLQRAKARRRIKVKLRPASVEKDANDRKTVRVGKARVLPIAKAQAVLALEESELARLGEDAQLSNVDLQNVLQRQQQLLKMLSAASKLLHDTAAAVMQDLD